MSIDTLANVKSRLGITSSADDTLLGQLQDSADAYIEQFCGRSLTAGTFTEDFAGSSEFLLLRNFPVDSVTSVKLDPSRNFGSETILPSSMYVIHADRGVIQFPAGPSLSAERTGLVNSGVQPLNFAPGVLRVVYVTLTTHPEDLRAAYARLIGFWYRKVKTEVDAGFRNVSQQKFGDSFVIFGSSAGEIPAEVIELLQRYRVPSL